jgi:hypothetical protein
MNPGRNSFSHISRNKSNLLLMIVVVVVVVVRSSMSKDRGSFAFENKSART